MPTSQQYCERAIPERDPDRNADGERRYVSLTYEYFGKKCCTSRNEGPSRSIKEQKSQSEPGLGIPGRDAELQHRLHVAEPIEDDVQREIHARGRSHAVVPAMAEKPRKLASDRCELVHAASISEQHGGLMTLRARSEERRV